MSELSPTQHSINSRKLNLVILILAIILSACESTEFEDLQTYVNNVKERGGKKIPPLPAVQKHKRFVYDDKGLRDPFKPVKPRVTRKRSNSKLRPNTNRKPEVLEKFPLDTLRLVGSLKQGGERWAIIKTSDGFIHRVKVGNYAGKNFGKIVSITESKVIIKEIIEDGLGGWIERKATLTLNQ